VDNILTYLFGSRDFFVMNRITNGECTFCSNVRVGFRPQIANFGGSHALGHDSHDLVTRRLAGPPLGRFENVGECFRGLDLGKATLESSKPHLSNAGINDTFHVLHRGPPADTEDSVEYFTLMLGISLNP
jgi:hypothetical protein